MHICKSVHNVQHWVATPNIFLSGITSRKFLFRPRSAVFICNKCKSQRFFLLHFQLHYFIKTELFSWPGRLEVLDVCVCWGRWGGGFHKWICQSPNSSHCWHYKIWLLKKTTDNFLVFLFWIEEDTEIAGFQIECANTANQSLPFLKCKTPLEREWKNKSQHHFHHCIFRVLLTICCLFFLTWTKSTESCLVNKRQQWMNVSSCHLVLMEAVDQHSPSPSQQPCQGMFPAGTMGPALILAGAAQSHCTWRQGRGHPMPGGKKHVFAILFYEIYSISFSSIGLGMLVS